MKMWIVECGTGMYKGDSIEVLSDTEATLFFTKAEAEGFATDEGDVIIEVEVTSVKLMEAQVKPVVIYSDTKGKK